MLTAMRYLLCTLLLILVPAVHAETVYRSVDENGNTVFSDKPSKGAETMEIPDAQTVKSPSAGKFHYQPPARKPPPEYSSVAITSPDDDAAVRQNDGNITVQVAVRPDLQGQDQLQLLMDGKIVGSGSNTSFSLQNLNRGTHTLQAVVIGSSGKTLASSATVTFHLLRHSILNKPPPKGPLNPPGGPVPAPSSR